MERLPRSASRLILATTVVLGCSTGAGGAASRSGAGSRTLAAADHACLVADTTAPTADTIFVIGADSEADDVPIREGECAASRRQRVADLPVVVWLRAPDTDLRDLMDGAVGATGGQRPDVLVTRDAEVLAYARRREDFLVAALPWSTTYLLVAAGPLTMTGVGSSAERDALARDAVTSDARGAAGAFPWLTDTACVGPALPATTAQRPLLAFAAGDPVALELAARIRSRSGERDPIVILPVASASIPDLLASGRATAGVLPLSRDPRTRCGTRGNGRVPAGAVPLVDTRAHVIIRRGSGAALLVSPDGSFRVLRRTAR